MAEEWGALDEYVVNEQAHVLPYGYEESSQFFSERMDAENCSAEHPVYKTRLVAVLPEVDVDSAVGGRLGAVPPSMT